MNEDKIRDIFSDESFVKQLLELDEPEEVNELLIEKDIEISLQEIIHLKEMLEKQMNGEVSLEELSDEDLEDVSGGLIAIGIMVAACTTLGVVAGVGSGFATHVFSRRRW